jgi:hypothetical protein
MWQGFGEGVKEGFGESMCLRVCFHLWNFLDILKDWIRIRRKRQGQE